MANLYNHYSRYVHNPQSTCMARDPNEVAALNCWNTNSRKRQIVVKMTLHATLSIILCSTIFELTNLFIQFQHDEDVYDGNMELVLSYATKFITSLEVQSLFTRLWPSRFSYQLRFSTTNLDSQLQGNGVHSLKKKL